MIPTDARLCAALADNVPDNFDKLINRFQRRLFAFALRLTGRYQDAEDVLQEAFVAAFVSLENYPPERIRTLQLQAWLYKVTLHTYQHRNRRVKAPDIAPIEDVPEGALAQDAAEQPEVIFERMERRQELLTNLERLPERYRIPTTCYYLEHMSYQEIADMLDQPLGTVKSAIHRGLAQLRLRLTPHENEG